MPLLAFRLFFLAYSRIWALEFAKECLTSHLSVISDWSKENGWLQCLKNYYFIIVENQLHWHDVNISLTNSGNTQLYYVSVRDSLNTFTNWFSFALHLSMSFLHTEASKSDFILRTSNETALGHGCVIKRYHNRHYPKEERVMMQTLFTQCQSYCPWLVDGIKLCHPIKIACERVISIQAHYSVW